MLQSWRETLRRFWSNPEKSIRDPSTVRAGKTKQNKQDVVCSQLEDSALQSGPCAKIYLQPQTNTFVFLALANMCRREKNLSCLQMYTFLVEVDQGEALPSHLSFYIVIRCFHGVCSISQL